jgi:choline-sulfatase
MLVRLGNHEKKDTMTNILLIMTDEQCSHAMSCAGSPYVTTPAMDRLAANGVLFRQAYTTQPLCIPCRSALQVGRWPHQTGVMVNHQGTVLDNAPAYPMIGRLVADAGYRCGYIGKMHIAHRNQQGDRKITLMPDQVQMHGYDPCIDCVDSEVPGRAVRFLESVGDQPFFLTASFVNPHDCMIVAQSLHSQQELIGPVPDDPDELPPLPDNAAIPEHEPSAIRDHYERFSTGQNGTGAYVPYPTGDWDELHWRQYLWAYYRLIEHVDSQIGVIIDALEATGKANDTLIIFTADHGDGAAHHGWYQKQVLYEEAVRVPLVVSAPDMHSRGSVDESELMSWIDIAPTILDYAGVRHPEHMEGQSMRPLLETGAWSSHDYVVTETLFGVGKDITGQAGRMVRTKDFKYVVYNDGENPEQLTDMNADPGETRNLAVEPAYEGVLQQHRDTLKEWCSETGDTFDPSSLHLDLVKTQARVPWNTKRA